MSIRLFGSGFSRGNVIKFDEMNQTYGTDCEHQIAGEKMAFSDVDADGFWADVKVKIKFPKYTNAFICVGVTNKSTMIHQGNGNSVIVQTRQRYSLPFGIQVFLLILLLFMSGMFSGLNLGLMALDKTELQIVINCGTKREKEYAKKIQPIRNRGNYLLCTVLVSNVLVNSTLTILMDELTGGGGLVAIVGSTLGIVVFGEIIPQAVCSRHGLAVGANTILITKFFMLITFPLSFPVSILLDKALGEEIGNVYGRNRLRDLIKVTAVHTDIETDEMKMIAGALSLTEQTVGEVMTPLVDVYMVSIDTILDFQTMSDIMKRGYTRIPVFHGTKSNITGLLNIRDLAFVDPDDCVPLKTVCNFYQHHSLSVIEDMKLDAMLQEFKKGQCHMAVVQSVNNEGKGDPFYEVVGIVTLEDIIEEIIQAEILDETDVIIDNKKKVLREMPQNPDFAAFANQEDQGTSRISPQLSLAIFQFLSANVEPFQECHITSTILRRLIKKSDVIEDMPHKDSKPVFIYEQNKPADFFCLILQGSVEVNVGKEELVYETGPFSYFGVKALTSFSLLASVEVQRKRSQTVPNDDPNSLQVREMPGTIAFTNALSFASNSPDSLQRASSKRSSRRKDSYIPDFSVKTLVATQVLKVSRSHYLAAHRASVLEKQPKGDATTPTGDDVFNKEWDKTMSAMNGTAGAPKEPTTITGTNSNSNSETLS
jgi:metal transporter CNNM